MCFKKHTIFCQLLYIHRLITLKCEKCANLFAFHNGRNGVVGITIADDHRSTSLQSPQC